MNSFNYVENFIRFVTDAHVVCLTMDVCGMTELTDVPYESAVNESRERKSGYFNDVCTKVVERVWKQDIVDISSKVQDVDNEETSTSWCLCRAGN